MVRVTDRDATVHVISAHNHADALRRSRGIRALGFGDQVRVRNPAMHQVIVAYAAFAVTGICRRAACGDDNWRDALLK